MTHLNLTELKQLSNDNFLLVPLGGCGEFGMNITAYLHKGRLFIVDFGLMFTPAEKLGVDAQIPFPETLIRAFGGVEAYLITHGHEDHLGASVHILKAWPAPVYCSAWTKALLVDKLGQARVSKDEIAIFKVDGSSVSDLGQGLEAHWVHVNHSIPGTLAINLRSADFSIFHTGDFRIDHESLYEPPADLGKMKLLGERGIDLLLSDSTNAHQKTRGPAEKDAKKAIAELTMVATGASIITTFASNFWRLLSVIEICKSQGKKLLVLGRGMERSLKFAAELGLIPADLPSIITEGEKLPNQRSDLVVLASGCQGEHQAALSRLTRGPVKQFSLEAGDQLIFSSRVIPGNEVSFLEIINLCLERGLKVFTSKEKPEIHASGHACQPDLKEMIEALKPKSIMPVHGTYFHLDAARRFASGLGPEKMTPLEARDGDIFKLVKNSSPEKIDKVSLELLYVDQLSGALIDQDHLEARLRIGTYGLYVLTGTIKLNGHWICPLTADLIGIPDEKAHQFESELESFASEIASFTKRSMRKTPRKQRQRDLNKFAENYARRLIGQRFGQRPSLITRLGIIEE